MPSLIDNKYEIVSKLGEGGQGTIYKARHVQLESFVALKLLPAHLAANPNLVGRFQREAKVQARFKHPNIVRVTDIVNADGLFYLVMDFIAGDDLRRIVRANGALELKLALEIAAQIGDALAYAHEHDVVHRDVKPSNILIESQDPLRAMLFDFGIAKEEGGDDHTQTGSLVGSYRYSAPEQLGFRLPGTRTPLSIDGRTDVYALGLVLFEMCEGSGFFAGLSEADVIGRVVYDAEPLEPVFTRQRVPAPIVEVVRRAIQRYPAARFQTMREMVAGVRQSAAALQGPSARGVIVPKALSGGDDSDVSNEQLESLIRDLEFERLRRAVLNQRSEVQAVRQQAIDVGALPRVGDIIGLADVTLSQAEAEQRSGRLAEARDLVARAGELLREAVQQARQARPAKGVDVVEAGREASRARDATALEDCKSPAESEERLQRVREAAAAARAAAERCESPTFAPALFAEGITLESGAESHAAHGDTAEAVRLYLDARAAYDEATASASVSRSREEAIAARDGALASRKHCIAMNAAQLANEPFVAAARAFDAAEAQFSEGRWKLAATAFDRVEKLFEQARAKASRLLGEGAVLSARQRACAARESAEGAEYVALAVEFWDRACARVEQAQSRFESDDLEVAAELYQEAAENFERATHARREADRLAKTRAEAHALAKAAIAEAHEATLAARAAAESVEAAVHANELWQHAVAAQSVALDSLERDDLEQAIESFTAASDLFRTAATSARTVLEERREERQRDAVRQEDVRRSEKRAIEARVEMRAARSAAESADAKALAADDWNRAGRVEGLAEQTLKRGAHDEASRLFNEAAGAFASALDQASKQREARQQEFIDRKRIAFEKQARADAARQSAEDVDAGHLAPEEHSDGASCLRVAHEALHATRFEEAGDAFDRAAAAFDKAIASARAQEARRATEQIAGGVATTATAIPGSENELATPGTAFLGSGATLGAPEAIALRAPTGVQIDRDKSHSFPDQTTAAPEIRGRQRPIDEDGTGAKQSPPRLPDESSASSRSATVIWAGVALAACLVGAVLYFKSSRDVASLKTLRENTVVGGDDSKVRIARERLPVDGAESASGTNKPQALPTKLSWETLQPGGGVVTVPEGQQLLFEATLRTESGEPSHAMRWLLDGTEVGTGSRWQFEPDFLSGGKSHEVKVVATSDDKRLENAWRVNVANVNRAPTIAKADPAVDSVELTSGHALTFEVDATDPDIADGDHLGYRWLRNGKEVANGSSPRWLLERPSPDDKEVRVVIVDSAGDRPIEKAWKVALRSDPGLELAPKIVSQTPAATKAVRLVEGGSIEFRVGVGPVSRTEPVQTWYVDGKEVKKGDRLRYQAPQSIEKEVEKHRVEVEVQNTSNSKASIVGWDVEVRWGGPEIVSTLPAAGKAKGAVGDTLRFSVTGKSLREGPPLQFEWSLDGKGLTNSESSLVLPSDLAPGDHIVEVVAVDSRSTKSAVRRWQVSIVDNSAPPQDQVASRKPSGVPPPSTAKTSEGDLVEEARQWLRDYEAALNRKDVATIGHLRQLDNAAQQRLADTLAPLIDMRVVFHDVNVQLLDATSVVISYTRSDEVSDAKTGQRVPKSTTVRQVLVLQDGKLRAASGR